MIIIVANRLHKMDICFSLRIWGKNCYTCQNERMWARFFLVIVRDWEFWFQFQAIICLNQVPERDGNSYVLSWHNDGVVNADLMVVLDGHSANECY